MSAPSYYDRKAEYARQWVSMEVRPSREAGINATADKIIAKKTRYQAVEAVTRVPWYVIGLIHAMEGGCNFATHLHNGDSLARRTVQVPAGRPREGEPPFQWKDSAIDAICYDGLDKVGSWSIERICYELEKFNGWGYVLHHSEVNSPYLWSGTNHYARGKYVADGQWSSSAVSGQSGAMPILKRIMELDDAVRPNLSTDAPEPIEERIADPAAAFRKAVPEGAVAGAVAGTVAADEPPESPVSGSVVSPDKSLATVDPIVATPAGEPKPRRDLDYLNEIADQASRLATHARNAWTAIKLAFGIGTGVTGTVVVANQAGLIDPSKGNAAVATGWGAQHPWLMLLIGMTLVLVVLGGILVVFFPKIIRGIVSAYKAGRYTPPAAASNSTGA